jgi:hypothetical protein
MMGLDSYLTAKRSFYDFRKEDSLKVQELADIVGYEEELEQAEVSLRIGYWRKANHIHKWFVDNVQDGKDECQESYVSREQLETLLDTCKKVLDSPVLGNTILPTQSGFFFGGTEYDEWYLQDVNNTIDILEKVLNNPIFKQKGIYWDFFYRASW